MSGPDLLDIARDTIWVLVKVVGPLMSVALGVGLVVAIFQSLTQIQEMTLTFIPKILATFLSLLLFLPFMGSTLNGFMERMAAHIANIP
jgi:flagellar biosynthetic protein FliQ